MASSRVSSFSWVLLFRGVTSFEPIGLPYFRRILDSFINCPTGTSICAGVFAAGIYDFVMHLVIDLQDFANERSFELLVHIDLYDFQDGS